MIKHLVTISLALSSLSAHACKDNFEFAKDKQQHFAVSAALGSAARTLTDDLYKGFAIGITPGIAKEVYDIRNGCVSGYDLFWDSVGVIAGFYGTGIVIKHNFIGYTTPF